MSHNYLNLNKIEKDILLDLVNIYERRAQNSSTFRNKVAITINKEKYPKYFVSPSEYDEAIKSLEKNSFIKIKYLPHDTVIKEILLNLDKVIEIEELLGVKSTNVLLANILELLAKYDDAILVKLKEDIMNRQASNKSIKQFLKPEYLEAINAVHYFESLDHDVYERNASNYLFNDSKRLSKIKSIIENIYQDDDIFTKKGILKNVPYLFVKGEGIITINDETIDLRKLQTSIGIPIDNLTKIHFSQITKVTTIENLTTFYDYESDGLIIYLGGFSTRRQMSVLRQLKEETCNFYHFGDIDFGGYTILNNLMEALNIDIKAINMDLETLKDNLAFAQAFDDENYVEKLKTLLVKPQLEAYYDVINYLIVHKVWLEQESFYNR